MMRYLLYTFLITIFSSCSYAQIELIGGYSTASEKYIGCIDTTIIASNGAIINLPPDLCRQVTIIRENIGQVNVTSTAIIRPNQSYELINGNYESLVLGWNGSQYNLKSHFFEASQSYNIPIENATAQSIRIEQENREQSKVVWGDGSYSLVQNGVSVNHIYSSSYTGDIIIETTSDIRRLDFSMSYVSQDIANLPPNLRYYFNAGQNASTGLIDNLPNTLTHYSNDGANTATGNISNLPDSIYYFRSFGNSAISDYTGRTWGELSYFASVPTSGGLDEGEVDALLNDFSTSATWNGLNIIIIEGTNAAPSANSSTAVANLQAAGVQVFTN